ncbi:chemotaxis protein CheB [Verticiella sediminum]|uniref:protein-glutamate methylesterase n=1 Tax=Verticiella sediminum TaxID=1247510 RepID=A0A556AYB4_9BURK|nr:chemotaxis protein CheB [Verticiella sediminum]TSH97886.1 chemotaxis protein CheB [Verticiella sediminum]
MPTRTPSAAEAGPAQTATGQGACEPELVVVGASAGGVQALGAILPRLPADWQPCMVVVMHMPARRRSRLAELFAPNCAVPVLDAEDKIPLLPGGVLFAPAGYHTLIESPGSIALSLDEPQNYSRPSVDVLFESAAWALRERVLGVLLTGANADGAQGLLQIRRVGGRTWVQSPATAFAPEMPNAALALEAAEATLDLETIAACLAEFSRPASVDAGTQPRRNP